MINADKDIAKKVERHLERVIDSFSNCKCTFVIWHCFLLQHISPQDKLGKSRSSLHAKQWRLGGGQNLLSSGLGVDLQ